MLGGRFLLSTTIIVLYTCKVLWRMCKKEEMEVGDIILKRGSRKKRMVKKWMR